MTEKIDGTAWRNTLCRTLKPTTKTSKNTEMKRYLTPEEEKTLFQTVNGVEGWLARRDSAWMSLLRQTGMRIANLATLTVDDARKGIAHKHLDLRDEYSKRKNGYTVYLNKKAVDSLKTLLKCRKNQQHSNEPDAPLIMSRNRRGMSIRSFQSRMRYWVDNSDIPVPASPHWFRHTLAMRILKNSTHKNPLSVVQKALGHASFASTAHYTGATREDVALGMEEAS